MPDENESNQPPPPPAPSGGLYSQGEKISKINVADEIKNSFLDYSMSVIISRALPDVRDGLKPSQRRILFAMNELGVMPNRKHLKCAKIVGETMGNYHPHGDQAIYPTLVHMAQPWAMRERLVDSQGNFGSVEGDPPASMRYTEARLTHLGAVLMEDMEKDTVDFVPNYDETRTEPRVFPAAFPNLLVNGGTGIAVGMATNMPPHNLGEVIDGVCAQIDKPNITIPELMKFIKGPDFPTGGTICGVEGIKNYFTTGKGSVKLRGRVGLEELKGNREQLVITEIPFNVNRANLEEQIANLVNEKIITEISAMRNESDEHCRLVMELKREAIPKVVIANLYQHTQLEVSFSVNSLAIDHGRPKTLNLKEIIQCYIEHRREVVLRRTRFELKQAEERAEILEGYVCALRNLDEFIRLIRGSRNREEARVKLLAFEWTRPQVETWGILIRSDARLTGGLLHAHGAPGGRHSRIAVVSSDRIGNGQSPPGIRRIAGENQGSARHSGEGITRDGDHQGRAGRDQGKARHAAQNGNRAGRRRDCHRGSDRQRRRHHHAHAQRAAQAHEREPIPRPAARRQRRHRHDHARRRDRRRQGFRGASVHGQHA